MTEQSMTEHDLIRELLLLINGGVFPGKGKKANLLIATGNAMLGETVGKHRRVAGQ